MVQLALLLALMSLAFWVYVLFDVIGSDTERIRLLPKPVWAVIVLLLPKLGAALWFLLGRPPREPALPGGPVGPAPTFPEYEHPGRARAASPEEDEAFLRRCRERAEAQRRRAREMQERKARETGGPGAETADGLGPETGGPRGHDGDEDPAGPAH
ncbi:PLD nuclease N-terminal domain-containing protein [Nocardiopsis terrae]